MCFCSRCFRKCYTRNFHQNLFDIPDCLLFSTCFRPVNCPLFEGGEGGKGTKDSFFPFVALVFNAFLDLFHVFLDPLCVIEFLIQNLNFRWLCYGAAKNFGFSGHLDF